MNDSETALAELNGFLQAFAWVNNKCDHGYTFEATWLDRANGIQSALEEYFRTTATAVNVERLSDWRPELGAAVRRWLFAYQFDPPSSGRLADPAARFSLSHETFRDDVVKIVLDKLSSAIAVERAWRVRITSIGFYECGWEDYALESHESAIFLHLGVSD